MKGLSLSKQLNFDPQVISSLNDLYYNALPNIVLNSKISKREFLISPLLIQIVQLIDVNVDTEKSIDINDKLSGGFDYLLQTQKNIFIIKAEYNDMESGFKQLVAELIALDQYEETPDMPLLYGAITLGNFWKFAV